MIVVIYHEPTFEHVLNTAGTLNSFIIIIAIPFDCGTITSHLCLIGLTLPQINNGPTFLRRYLGRLLVQTSPFGSMEILEISKEGEVRPSQLQVLRWHRFMARQCNKEESLSELPVLDSKDLKILFIEYQRPKKLEGPHPHTGMPISSLILQWRKPR